MGYDVRINRVGVLGISVDAHVDDAHAGPRLTCENVDGRASAHEIEHHLRGDLRGVGRGLCGARNSVITGEDHHAGSGEGSWRAGALRGAHPDREILETSESTGGLGEHSLAGAGLVSSLSTGY